MTELALNAVENDPRLTKVLAEMKSRYETLRTELEGQFEHMKRNYGAGLMKNSVRLTGTNSRSSTKQAQILRTFRVKPNEVSEIKEAWRKK